jgi:hypothetical protein
MARTIGTQCDVSRYLHPSVTKRNAMTTSLSKEKEARHPIRHGRQVAIIAADLARVLEAIRAQ